MERNFRAYLYDIIKACQNIACFTSDLDFETYGSDIRTRAACERMFEIIGEALRRLRTEFPDLYAQIPDGDQIIAFRNIITHGYDIIDDELVWSIIKNEVPSLRLKCEECMGTE
ncbi:MAG: hypothetical protein ETSY1_12225 [Candidatus Entotheonella factor]|uniref:DUF86 domain-containing protein n=2 Tax=Candidatus Entotheonella TaxID=93171 RepID=W4LQ22_ENTF1|nr:MAG: hypothetical protein ETSY1_12225 [Candidatus Entotheonella factor]